MAKRITLDLLTEKGACREQRTLFAKLFPNGTEVTRQLCIRYAEEFDFDWALENLLPEEAEAECDRINIEAWAEYERVRSEAWAEYLHTQDKAWAEYVHTQGIAWAKYNRTRDKAWAECNHIRGKAWTEYKRVCATEFARLWLEYMSD